MEGGLAGGTPPSRSPLARSSPTSSMIEHLKARAVRGVAWTGASQMASNVVQLATVVVLARLLSPGDFGVFGIAAVLLGLPTAVVDMGLGAALLQREQTSQRELSTYFWSVLTAAAVFSGVGMAASPVLARLFQAPILGGVIVVASFRLIVDALQMAQRVVLRRRLSFESIAVAEIVAVTASGVTAIGLAGLGWGVWSLAWASLLRGGIEGVLLWGGSAWRPTRQFSARDLLGLLPFGRNVVGKSVVSYLSSNVDSLVIAKLLTASDLGVYRLAYSLGMFPQERLAPMVTRVAFPVLSKVQHDDARLRHGYLEGVKYLALISFPLLVGLVVVAQDAVAVVFGAQWLASAVPLQLFCGLGLLYSVSTLMTSVFLAKGRPEIEFRGNAVLLGVTVVAVLIGVRFGATGVAAAVTLASALGVYTMLGFLNRLIRLRWRDYGSALRPAVTACIAMALALAFLRSMDTVEYLGSDLASLVAMAVVGIGVYTGALVVMERALVSELFHLYRMTRGVSGRGVHAKSASWHHERPGRAPATRSAGGRLCPRRAPEMTKVSVIIPCFNTGQFLEECVESVTQQGVPDTEVIVVDDGSTEEATARALRRTAIRWPELRVMRTEHHNVGAARNSGFGQSSGEFVVFLDSDDMLGKDFLPATVEALERREDCGVAFSDIELFGLTQGVWRTGPLWWPGEIYVQNYLQHCSLIRRLVLERYGGFNPNLWSSEDWDLWIKLHRHGVRFTKVEGVRARYRKRENSKLSLNRVNRPYLVNRVILNHKAAYGRVFLVSIGSAEERRVQGLLDAWCASDERESLARALRGTRLYRQFAAYSLLYRALRRISSPMFHPGVTAS